MYVRHNYVCVAVSGSLKQARNVNTI